MTYTYTEILDTENNLIGILRNEDKAAIPIDPANSDYQAYLNKDKPQVEHLTGPLTDIPATDVVE